MMAPGAFYMLPICVSPYAAHRLLMQVRTGRRRLAVRFVIHDGLNPYPPIPPAKTSSQERTTLMYMFMFLKTLKWEGILEACLGAANAKKYIAFVFYGGPWPSRGSN